MEILIVCLFALPFVSAIASMFYAGDAFTAMFDEAAETRELGYRPEKPRWYKKRFERSNVDGKDDH